MSSQSADVLVIGGGLHGLSTALHLARAGQRVIIVEQSWTGRHASGASAAGVRTLNRAIEELPISLESMDMWRNIEAMVGDHCGFHAYGQIQVAQNTSDVAVLEKRLAHSRAAGYDHEVLVDQAELRRMLPAITPDCAGALMVGSDGAADPHRTLLAFRRSAEAEGVIIREGCGVTQVERTGSAWKVFAGDHEFLAPTIVNAAGAWAGKIAALFGDDIPLGYKASMMIVTERIAPLVKPVVSLVGRPLSFKQTSQGTLLIGGGLQGFADIAAQKSHVNFLELAKGARAATELFPTIGPLRIVRAWTGMEAKTDDLLPVIGASPQNNGVYNAFGFSGHGFQLVPVVGAILAELIVHGGTNRPIEAFAAQRLMNR